MTTTDPGSFGIRFEMALDYAALDQTDYRDGAQVADALVRGSGLAFAERFGENRPDEPWWRGYRVRLAEMRPRWETGGGISLKP